MDSWVSEVASALIAETDWAAALRERTSSARLVTWVFLHFPPELLIFLAIIGLVWVVSFIAGSAFYTSREVVTWVGARVTGCRRRALNRNNHGLDDLETIRGRPPTAIRQESVALTGVTLPALGDSVEDSRGRRARTRGNHRIE